VVRLHQLITARSGCPARSAPPKSPAGSIKAVTGRTRVVGAKATSAPVGADQLRRLEHLRGLLPRHRVDQPPKILLYSRTGFTTGLTDEAAARPDVELVGIDRIYHGA